MRNVTCVRYESPSHGWTAVPQQILREVLPKGQGISKFSYYDPKLYMCYLEEDCDFPFFFKRAQEHGIEILEREELIEDDSFIRQLPRFWGW